MSQNLNRYLGRKYLQENKGASASDQADVYKKLTGKDYDISSEKTGLDRNKARLMSQYEDLFTKANRFGKGGGELKPQTSLTKFGQQRDPAAEADKIKQQLFAKAFQQTVEKNLYTQSRDISDDKLRELGDAGKSIKGGDNYWSKLHNNLTGADEYMRNSDASRYGHGLGGNWKRNQPAWQAGIGAVTGLLTGGPVGMIAGGAAGYASGARSKKADDASFQEAKLGATELYDSPTTRSTAASRLFQKSRQAGAGQIRFNTKETI